MEASKKDFLDSLSSLSRDRLIDLAVSQYSEITMLKLREEANERINTETHIQYVELKEKYESLLKEHDGLKELYRQLVEKDMLKTRSTFGRSTEKFLSLVDSAENRAEDFEDEKQDEDDGEASRKPGRVISFDDAKKGRDGTTEKDSDGQNESCGRNKNDRDKNSLKKSLGGLPYETLFDIDIEELNHIYGEGNWRILFWHEHSTIEKMPATYYVKQVYTPVLSTGLEHSLVTMPYCNLLMPRSYASPSLVSDILYRKFVLGLPFHRQAMDFSMSGICLSKQTIIHWANTIVPEFLDAVWEYLVSCLVKQRYIQSDETYMQVNRDGRSAGSKSFMWVHCTSELLDCAPVIVFCYEKTRNTDHLRGFFAEFLGYITCDAYISYQVLENESGENIKVAGCLMHCRRYFAESFFVNDVASMSDEELAALPETKALLLIREIYAQENKLSGMPADERTAKRKKYVKPLVDEFFKYVHELFDSAEVYSDRLQKALTYAVNQEERLRMFLSDGNIPCDNGFSERIIRSYSIGRANWLFADTVKGAGVNATMYSIVETAKANGADVRMYIQYLLEKIPAFIEEHGETNPEFLESCMPWDSNFARYSEIQKGQAQSKLHAMFPVPEKPKTPRKGKPPSADNKNPPHGKIIA